MTLKRKAIGAGSVDALLCTTQLLHLYPRTWLPPPSLNMLANCAERDSRHLKIPALETCL